MCATLSRVKVRSEVEPQTNRQKVYVIYFCLFASFFWVVLDFWYNLLLHCFYSQTCRGLTEEHRLNCKLHVLRWWSVAFVEAPKQNKTKKKALQNFYAFYAFCVFLFFFPFLVTRWNNSLFVQADLLIYQLSADNPFLSRKLLRSRLYMWHFFVWAKADTVHPRFTCEREAAL